MVDKGCAFCGRTTSLVLLEVDLCSYAEDYCSAHSSTDIRVVLQDRLRHQGRRYMKQGIQFHTLLSLEGWCACDFEILAQMVPDIAE
jgi:hypothetical protein